MSPFLENRIITIQLSLNLAWFRLHLDDNYVTNATRELRTKFVPFQDQREEKSLHRYASLQQYYRIFEERSCAEAQEHACANDERRYR